MANRRTLVSTAIGTAFAASLSGLPTAGAAENPFELQPLSHGYQVAGMNQSEEDQAKARKSKEAKDKDGKESRPGASKKKEGKCGEGKCGEGKCGGSN
ncbi:MAG: hypothetical protein WCJ69_00715 [Betaproteobacteria bacterium]|jgi:uncharacterized low-complexity protein